jgi:hypothetical protein
MPTLTLTSRHRVCAGIAKRRRGKIRIRDGYGPVHPPMLTHFLSKILTV